MSQQNAQQVTPNKHSIRLESPMPFNATLEADLTTSAKLAGRIATFFSMGLPDLEGAIIYPLADGRLTCDLYFSHKGAGDVVTLGGQLPKGGGITGVQKITHFNQKVANRTLGLSDKAKEILSDFLPAPGHNKPVDFNNQNICSEIMETQAGYGAATYRSVLQIRQIDINKVLKALYGDRDEVTGGRIDYNVMPVKPIGQVTAGMSQNWLLSIQRLDNKRVEEVCYDLGYMATGSNLVMIKPDRV